MRSALGSFPAPSCLAGENHDLQLCDPWWVPDPALWLSL